MIRIMRFTDLNFEKSDEFDKRFLYTAKKDNMIFQIATNYGKHYIFTITNKTTGHINYYKIGHIHGKFETEEQKKKRLLSAFYFETLNDMKWEDF